MAEIDRTERLLALILVQTMGGASQQSKIAQLSVAGFTNIEIADLLQTTTAVVATSLYKKKQTKKKKKKKTK
jgi:DNA-binding NarL/FixJ family response regulator